MLPSPTSLTLDECEAPLVVSLLVSPTLSFHTHTHRGILPLHRTSSLLFLLKLCLRLDEAISPPVANLASLFQSFRSNCGPHWICCLYSARGHFYHDSARLGRRRSSEITFPAFWSAPHSCTIACVKSHRRLDLRGRMLQCDHYHSSLPLTILKMNHSGEQILLIHSTGSVQYISNVSA